MEEARSLLARRVWSPNDAGLLANCIAGLPGITEPQMDELADACPATLRDEVRTRLRYVPPNRHALGTLMEEVDAREHPGEPRPLTDGEGRPWEPRIPAPKTLEDAEADPPAEMPTLIGRGRFGILHDGGLMYVMGASKGGKSWMVENLAISVASGTEWLGMPCAKGRVLLCDFELSPRTLYERMESILSFRSALQGAPDYRRLCGRNLIRWALRDWVAPLDELRDDIVNHVKDMAYRDGCEPRGYIRMLILDPLYMIEMGDENSASDMARLFRVVRSIQKELGCAVVIVHHHAKGASGSKEAIDRGAGSGAIGRNGDAIVDVSRLFLDASHQERVNQNYRWAYRDDGNRMDDLRAFRVTFAGIRDFKAPRPLDVVWTAPVHSIADSRDRLGECEVVGTDAKAEMRARQSARAGNNHDAINRIVGDALAECERDGTEPTKANVYARCDWSDVGAVNSKGFDHLFETRNSDWFGYEMACVGGRKYHVRRTGTEWH